MTEIHRNTVKILGHVRIALTFYPKGSEITRWVDMPQVPNTGDTVHFSLTDNPDDSLPWHVKHVSWVFEDGFWHAELGLS